MCAEHKKVVKLLKHLAGIKKAAAGMRNLPRVMVFANTVQVAWVKHALHLLSSDFFPAIYL